MTKVRHILLVALLFCTVGFVFAQEPERKSKVKVEPVSKTQTKKDAPRTEPLVRTELGLGVGARYPWMELVKPAEMSAMLNARMGFGAALQFRISIGKFFGIQPEVVYTYSVIKLEDTAYNLSAKIKSSLVQMPVLISLRAAMFRFNFGPVFTLMDSPYYMLSDEKVLVGRLYPTVTYAAGVSVKFAKSMMLDVRYSGQFRDIKETNAYTYKLDADAIPFKTRNSSVQLRFGYVF